MDEDFLPRDEQHWEIQVYGCHTEQLDRQIDAEYSFDMSLELSDDTDTVVGVVYPYIINRFEDEYADCVDWLQYLEPEKLND